jgi:hypothetical protein
VGLLPNMMIEILVGTRTARTRVLRVLGRDLYLEALAESDSDLTPALGQEFRVAWFDEDMRWVQAARMQDVLATLPILLVNLEGKATRGDQRRVPRARVTLPIEYGIPRRERHITTTLDLSVAGLRFPSAIPLWHGLTLDLAVRIGGELMRVRATVVRVDKEPKDFRGRRGWETAVHFVGLSRRERAYLESFVTAHLERKKTSLPSTDRERR